MRRRFLSLWGFVVLALVLSLLAPGVQAKGQKQPPAPVAAGSGGEVSALGFSSPGGTPGTWYVGATPPNVDYAKPVLLFVHGKGGWAGIWWQNTVYHGTNDMYTYAYNNGYRTAFVDLHPEGSMWANGELLKSLLDSITAYFGVSKVNIVAHSKGGVDANTASVHYGANPKIAKVITLGTPHWGTPLADMAYSNWTWWLAELLGQTGDATYVMQTGYMNYFRSITDTRDPSVPYYTLSGYKCGPLFSALWMGCVAIGGEDDGVVPVWSARKPGSTHLKEGYWDHDEIRMGSRVWSYISPYLRTAALSGAVAAEGAMLAAAPGAPSDAGGLGGSQKPQAPGNVILRGGSTAGAAAPAFPVESGVRSATFEIYASSSDFAGTLTGPDGSTHTVKMTGRVPQGEILAGAWVGAVEVTAPAAGSWSLSGSAAGQAGYLMVASLDSDLKVTLDVGDEVSAPGEKRGLAVGFTGASPKSSRAEASVGVGLTRSKAGLGLAGGKHVGTVEVPAATGVQNVTVAVTGSTADGSAFERTLVSSFAAVPVAERGRWR